MEEYDNELLDSLDLTAPTVEDFLNNINYSIDGAYIPSSFACDFITFIKLVNGEEGESHKSPVVHYKMLDNICNNEADTINMCHRGMAKTAVLGEYLFLYLAVFGEIPGFGNVSLAIYVSDSIDNGVKNMRKNLEHRWFNSEFLQRYLPNTKFTDTRWEFNNIDGRKFIVKGYGAKALSLDTELFTETGKITIGECAVGDRIYGIDGKLTSITKKSEVFNKPMYRIELEDGRWLKVSEDHLNPVTIKQNPNNKVEYVNAVIPTSELLELPLVHERLRTRKGKSNYTSRENLVFVKNIDAIEYPTKELPIDPYTLGVILGDGRIRKECGSVELTAHKDEFAHYYKEIPYEFGAYREDPRSNAATQSIRKLGPVCKELGINVRGELKFIPDEYWTASVDQRLSLVQGLMDTDGTCSENGRVTFSSSSYQLCDDLACLVRSLGGSAKFGKCGASNAYRIEVWMNQNCFRLPRKVVRFKARSKDMAIKAISPIPEESSQCIAVDNESRQFIAGCYFPTHNTGVRGAKEMGIRPQLAVLDDLLSDEDARSPTVIASIEDTVTKAIDYALDPTHKKIIWSGTPFNASDPLYKAVESGAWKVNVYPVCEKFPCTREEFKGSWEDRFSYDYVMKQYVKSKKSGKIESFNQELMLRIMSEEDRLIKDGDISWYERKPVLDHKDRYNFYITTDFATSEKTSADFSVISVWAYTNNEDWLWVDGICAKQDMNQNMDDLFRLVQMYNPMSVGVEVSGQQGGFVSWIQREMSAKNIWFDIASDNNSNRPGIRPNGNKLQRFHTMVPMFKRHKIKFPIELKNSAEMIQCMDELSLVSNKGFKSKHDDFSDTISMLSVLKPWAPSYEINMEQSGNGVWISQIDEDDLEDDRINSYVV